MSETIHKNYPYYSLKYDYIDPITCLYHYTSISAAKSILSSNTIWLASHKTANDFAEGIMLLDRIFLKQKNKAEAKQLLLDNYFFASFTINGNQLSQWRAYGDIAVGFNEDALRYNSRYIRDASSKDFSRDDSGTQLCTISYIDPSGSEIQNQIDSLNKLEWQFEYGQLQDKQRALLSIGDYCFTVKHCGFSEEQEVRLFSYLWGKSPQRLKSTRFIEYKLEPKIVEEIIIGPSKKKESNYREICDFINQHSEYSHIKVLKSGIPYKGTKRYGTYKYSKEN